MILNQTGGGKTPTKLGMFQNHTSTVKKKKHKSKPKPKHTSKPKHVLKSKSKPKPKTKPKAKNILNRDEAHGHAIQEAYNRAVKKVKASKPKPKTKPKSKPKTPTYSGGGDKGKLDGFIKTVKNSVKSKPKPKIKPKSNSLGSAGLDSNKYHGHTPTTTVPKSKVAPVQKKLPTRVPASSVKPKTTPSSKPKTTTHYSPSPAPSPVSKQAAYHAANKPVPTTPTGSTPVVKPTTSTTTTPTPPPVVPKTLVAPNEDMLRQMSLKALQGDVNAANYLKNNHLKGMTGDGLWKGYNAKDISKQNINFRHRYMEDNPLADYTKNYDMNNYKTYNDMIQNNKQMTDGQMNWYNKTINKWNLDDYKDPLVQYQNNLKKNQQTALNAQDVSLNKGLSTLDSNSFQQYQTLQQDMSNRGVSDSGIASDTYMRAQLGNNQSYQQAYADNATAKDDINSKYTDAIAQAKVDSRDYIDKRNDAFAQQEIDQQNALAKIQEQQTAQDKYLTASTGYVYLNGQVMTGSDGKAITSMDMMKLQETNRHNTANETIDTQKLSVSMQKINNDLAIATQKLQYNWASLDLKSSTASADIANAQAKLDLAARNADTAEVRAQAGILNNQLKNIQKQIDGYKKADKKVPAKLKSQLKSIMTKMSTLANMGK